MILRPPRSTRKESSAASDVYKRQGDNNVTIANSALTEVKALFTTDGASSLYYDNSSKIQTTSTGINVSGGVTVNGDVETSTTGKIKQKGAFMQSSTHQALVLGA